MEPWRGGGALMQVKRAPSRASFTSPCKGEGAQVHAQEKSPGIKMPGQDETELGRGGTTFG